MIALSVIVVACRFYTRLKLRSGLKWDDWFILISLVSLITAGVLVVAGTSRIFLCFFLSFGYTRVFPSRPRGDGTMDSIAVIFAQENR